MPQVIIKEVMVERKRAPKSGKDVIEISDSDLSEDG
jgi:hypothetical protein